MDYKNDAYEEQVASYKQRLFERLRALTPPANAVVIELGIGFFPNAPLYAGWENVQVLGLEPDTSKHAEAVSRAALCGLSLACRAEHLDALPPHSADAVVSTYTLCSVDDPQKTLAQVRRVLRPDGVFAFLEHVRTAVDGAYPEHDVRVERQQRSETDNCMVESCQEGNGTRRS